MSSVAGAVSMGYFSVIKFKDRLSDEMIQKS